jgi:hypothetical protein
VATITTEFELDGNAYRMGRLTAKQQFHVSRRIAPLLPPLLPVFLQIARDAGGDKLTLAAAVAPLLQPLASALSDLKDEDAERVMDTCLSVVQRRADGGNYTAVWNQAAGMAMFADMEDLAKLLPLVVRVIVDSLGPFISGFLTALPPGPATATQAAAA